MRQGRPVGVTHPSRTDQCCVFERFFFFFFLFFSFLVPQLMLNKVTMQSVIFVYSDVIADRLGLALLVVENCKVRQALVSQLMLNNVAIPIVRLV